MSSVAERAALVKSDLIDHIARVELRVRDIDKALSFYRDVVGLKVSEQSADRASLGTTEIPTFLNLTSSGVTAPADPRATGLFHTAIRFPTRPSLGDALARLAHAGMEIGAGDHLVSEALYIDDPDGNGVELYWDRPVEDWPPPAGDMITPMATLPVDLQSLLNDGSRENAVDVPAPSGTDIGHVHLQVSDVDATTRFYRDQVGLDLTARLGNAAAFFSSNGYHHHIGTNTWRTAGRKPASREQAGLDRVAFTVSSETALNDLSDRLNSSGIQVSRDGGDLVVHDPDGIELRFMCFVQ
ncbi:MAG: VOC family protein [Actinomycetota bacterium]